jgi:hypothetical protein
MGPCTYTGPVDSIKKPHGRGHALISNGRRYDGPFVHGVAEGDSATFFMPGNGTFEGSFQNDRFKEGKFTLTNGDFFVGTFKNGQPDVGNGNWYNSQGQILN